MRFYNTLLLILFLAGTVISQSVPGSTDKLTFLATDKSGRFVEGLSKEEVELSVNGKKAEILSLENTESPLLYVLAVDCTGSMRSIFDDVLNLASGVVGIGGPDDAGTIMSFVSNDKIRWASKFTTDKDFLTRTIDGLYVEGGQSAVMDAIAKAVDLVATTDTGTLSFRKAVLVISDGDDRVSKVMEKELKELLNNKGVEVYFVSLVNELSDEGGFISKRTPKQKAQSFIDMVTTESGGVAFEVNKKTDLRKLPADIMATMKTRYVISYQITAPTSDKKEITLNLSKTSKKDKIRFSLRN